MFERVAHVHYIFIDDLVITTPLIKKKKKKIYQPSGHALVDLVHLVLGQDVASLLSLCMAKWLRKWRRGCLYARSNTHTHTHTHTPTTPPPPPTHTQKGKVSSNNSVKQKVQVEGIKFPNSLDNNGSGKINPGTEHKLASCMNGRHKPVRGDLNKI